MNKFIVPISTEQSQRILILDEACRRAQEMKDTVIELLMLSVMNPDEVKEAFKLGVVTLENNSIIIG